MNSLNEPMMPTVGYGPGGEPMMLGGGYTGPQSDAPDASWTGEPGQLSLRLAHQNAMKLFKETLIYGVLLTLISVMFAGYTLGLLAAYLVAIYYVMLLNRTVTGTVDLDRDFTAATSRLCNLLFLGLVMLLVELLVVLLYATVLLAPLALVFSVYNTYTVLYSVVHDEHWFSAFARSAGAVSRGGFCKHFGAMLYLMFVQLFVFLLVLPLLLLLGAAFGLSTALLPNEPIVANLSLLMLAGAVVVMRVVMYVSTLFLQPYMHAFLAAMFLQCGLVDQSPEEPATRHFLHALAYPRNARGPAAAVPYAQTYGEPVATGDAGGKY